MSKHQANRRRWALNKVFNHNPKTKYTENQYKAMRHAMVLLRPELRNEVSPERLLWLCEEIPALQREWRRQTEGIQKEKKKKLAQEYTLNHGYSPNHYQEVKKLKTL